MTKFPIRKWLLIFVGVLSVILGTVGIVVPLLPTTPFLLLAAACFFRSSDKLYQQLITHKWFGSYIKNYRENKAIPKHAKVVILLLLWATLGYSTIVIFSSLIIRVILVSLGGGITFFILRIATMSKDDEALR